jgi:hypothetical protein
VELPISYEKGRKSLHEKGIGVQLIVEVTYLDIEEIIKLKERPK